jgi:hypothetical protein
MDYFYYQPTIRLLDLSCSHHLTSLPRYVLTGGLTCIDSKTPSHLIATHTTLKLLPDISLKLTSSSAVRSWFLHPSMIQSLLSYYFIAAASISTIKSGQANPATPIRVLGKWDFASASRIAMGPYRN